MAKSKNTPTSKPAVTEAIANVKPDAELEATQEVVRSITDWVVGLFAFWREARKLEQEARAAADQMKLAHLPASPYDDVELQELVKKFNGEKRRLLAKWEICSAVFQLHRRLTAKRDVGSKLYDEAINIGNRLHNEFADAAREKAREEQDRLLAEQRRADDAARTKELDRLEADAVRAEAEAPTLSEREQIVVDMVLAGKSWREGCQEAGYRDALAMAAKLADSPKVTSALEVARNARAIREQAAAKKALPFSARVAARSVEVAVQKAAGVSERTTWSFNQDTLDEQALHDAVFAGVYGIPRDVLRVDTVKLREYASSMGTLIDKWPGVQAKKTTRLV